MKKMWFHLGVLISVLMLLSSGLTGHSIQTRPVFAEQPPPSYSNTVEWSTASESDNFGFDVYRGESPDGPFTKLTPTPVPGGGNTDETRRYTFTDDTVRPDVQYYYYVESISLSGVREKFTPVFKAPIKSSTAAQPE